MKKILGMFALVLMSASVFAGGNKPELKVFMDITCNVSESGLGKVSRYCKFKPSGQKDSNGYDINIAQYEKVLCRAYKSTTENDDGSITVEKVLVGEVKSSGKFQGVFGSGCNKAAKAEAELVEQMLNTNSDYREMVTAILIDADKRIVTKWTAEDQTLYEELTGDKE